MLMYSLHVRICKSLVQGQPNISQFPCTVPIYNKSAKTFRDASQEPIFQWLFNFRNVRHFSCQWWGALVRVANGTIYAKQAHPKDICFTEEIDDKTKLNFSVELPLPKTLYILFPTTKKRKKGMYLLFFVLFTHYAKLCTKLPYLRTKLPIRWDDGRHFDVLGLLGRACLGFLNRNKVN